MAEVEHLDVIVVGGGLSGISAGYRLQTECPEKSYAILEARQGLGGTWDLFRYPGVRSDSDMVTLGFPFYPWTDEKVIVEGERIRDYIVETAAKFGIDRRVRFGHRLISADWSSTQKMWTLEVESQAGTRWITCHFLYMGSGYYDYAQGFSPALPGLERFQGAVVHPQHWPQELQTAGKRVVVIGSGATAISLVPALIESAEHVVMLQRSPSYVVSIPASDSFAAKLRRYLPQRWTTFLARWRSIMIASLIYRYAKSRPAQARELLLGRLQRYLSPDEIEQHFTPRYQPWDQRLCFAPNGDLLKALKSDKATIVTSTIDTFTEGGLRLSNGQELQADIVVTATGLVVKLFGGATLSIDGAPIQAGEHVAYKGMMLDGIPNLALAIGYTNMSWTLKCDLTARYMTRLLKHMDAKHYRECAPRHYGPTRARRPLLDFSSGYVQRASQALPSQGDKPPWQVRMSYLQDLLLLRHGPLSDGVMEFRR